LDASYIGFDSNSRSCNKLFFILEITKLDLVTKSK
jgi:hypothetical protein